MEKSNNSIKGTIIMLVGAIMFSAKAIMVKICYRYGIDASSLLGLRMIFSFPFFAGFAIYGYSQKLSVLPSSSSKFLFKISDWIKVFFLGIVGYYLASIFDFEGLKYVSAGVERLILFIYPTMVVVISALLFKQPITKKIIVALLLTYSGVGLVYWHDVSGKGEAPLLGVLLVIMSAFTYAIYLVGSGNLIPKFGAMFYTACAMLVSTLATISHQYWFSNQSLWGFQEEVYYIAMAMAIFSTVIPGFLVSYAIQLVGASQASIIASIGPISTIVLAYFFLGENFSWYQMAGTILVVTGVLWISKKN